jgi:hypothetical protein
MQTGGFKGKSREVEAAELRRDAAPRSVSTSVPSSASTG